LNKRYDVKPILLSGHARDQLRYRGATEEEVAETIQTSPWEDAEQGRMEAKKDFPFDAVWNKRTYATKRVRPIFVEEEEGIVVVTVYVYYY
jgi:hypothetical protein